MQLCGQYAKQLPPKPHPILVHPQMQFAEVHPNNFMPLSHLNPPLGQSNFPATGETMKASSKTGITQGMTTPMCFSYQPYQQFRASQPVYYPNVYGIPPTFSGGEEIFYCKKLL